MPRSHIQSSHDKLFKASLAHPEVAVEFLNLYLPESIKKELDFSTLNLCPTEFISKELQLSQSDVLFKTRVSGKEAYIYILAEHQSSKDKLMPFRLMQYMVCIWNFHIKQMGEKKSLPLPVIYPLVFFTGNSPYKGMQTLWELCGDNAVLMQQILQSPFQLIDVGMLSEEELIKHPLAGTLGFVLRKQFKNHLYEELKKIAANLDAIGLGQQAQYMVELINYIFNIPGKNDEYDVNTMMSIMHSELSPGVEKEIMSIAEKLKTEGRIEGELKGQLKAKIEIAQSMLAEGADPIFVAKVTKLPMEEVLKLHSKS